MLALLIQGHYLPISLHIHPEMQQEMYLSDLILSIKAPFLSQIIQTEEPVDQANPSNGPNTASTAVLSGLRGKQPFHISLLHGLLCLQRST